MIVTARAIAEYREMLRRISDKAANEVQQYMLDHHFEIDDAFLEYVDAIVVKYGEAAGSLSAQFYDNLAEYWQIQNASSTFVNVVQKPLQIAEVADLPTEDEIAKAIYGTMKESPNKIPSTVGRLVKRTAEDTTLQNAIRDGAQFAWVPNGDTCPFCIMLASRGWQYASKKALKNGHAEHIHPNCDCTYVARFDESSKVAGYDPDYYKDIYYSAQGDTPEERINAIRRELYRKKINGINFVDRSQVVNVLRSKYHPWVESLTYEEKRAIRKYTKNSFETGDDKFFFRLNAMLRGDLPEDETLKYYSEMISKALNKSPLEDYVICYRNISVDPFPEVEIGRYVKSNQFFSTSVVQSRALKGDYKLTIIAPPGTKGAYLEEISRTPNQREFLIDKDCWYRVIYRDDNEIILEVRT